MRRVATTTLTRARPYVTRGIMRISLSSVQLFCATFPPRPGKLCDEESGSIEHSRARVHALTSACMKIRRAYTTHDGADGAMTDRCNDRRYNAL